MVNCHLHLCPRDSDPSESESPAAPIGARCSPVCFATSPLASRTQAILLRLPSVRLGGKLESAGGTGPDPPADSSLPGTGRQRHERPGATGILRCWCMMMVRWLDGRAPGDPGALSPPPQFKLMSLAARWRIALACSGKAAWGGVQVDWALSCRMDLSCMSRPCAQVAR